MADANARPPLDDCVELLNLAVHELRTPAAVVGGYLRMLRLDTDGPRNPRQQKMIEEAEKSCARIVSLIAELSDVARLDAGTARLTRESFDLFEVLPDVAAGVHEADSREVQLQVRGEPSGALMQGDLARFRTTFATLFRAVLREQTSSSTVVVNRRLDTTGQAATATVVVADETAVQSALESTPLPFNEGRGGLGLLLPIAKRIIEHHGGRIWSPAPPAPPAAIVVSLPVQKAGSGL